jgi:dihydroorotate dehydrogenase (NAD+) catalytic subunit
MRAALFSLKYRAVRAAAIRCFSDLEDAVIFGDRALKKLDAVLGKILFDFPIPQNIGVRLHDLYFPSPLTFASFKDDAGILAIWLKMGLGGGTLKTILRDERTGNPRPRLIDTGDGLINAMGLPGKGVALLKKELAQNPIFDFGRPVGLSVGGNSLEEYENNFRELEKLPQKKLYFEINISCPNTPEGQDLIKHPDLLEKLINRMRAVSQRVIGVKVSPDQDDASLKKVAEMLRAVPKTYINAGNTRFQKSEKISIGGGGLSGAALFARTLEMTSLLVPLGVPVIATGGISRIEHVRALGEKGALLFGLATALVKDPYCVPRINSSLARA